MKASVKYQCKPKNTQTWAASNTIVDLPDISREAVRDFLLARNPNYSDIRIVEIKQL